MRAVGSVCKQQKMALLGLPPDVKTLHAYFKGATISVMRKANKTWLQGEAGKAWQEERKKLFAADERSSDED